MTDDLQAVPSILREAAEASEGNKPKDAFYYLRPSNVGLDLMTHVWKAFVEPKLLSLRQTQPQPKDRTYWAKRASSLMSVSIGNIYERILEPQILEFDFPGYQLFKQQELSNDQFSGRADFVLHNPELNDIVLIECKAVNKPTKREIGLKFSDDAWGYRSQLAIYTKLAIDTVTKETGGDVPSVRSFWYAWSVPSRKTFVFPFDYDPTLYAKAVQRKELFSLVTSLVANGEWVKAAKVACQELPKHKEFSSNGYAYGCCPFHFSLMHEVFYTEEGELLPHSECVQLLSRFLSIETKHLDILLQEVLG